MALLTLAQQLLEQRTRQNVGRAEAAVIVSSGLARLGATRTEADASGSKHPADDAAADTELGGQYPERRAGLVALDELTHLLRWQALAVR